MEILLKKSDAFTTIFYNGVVNKRIANEMLDDNIYLGSEIIIVINENSDLISVNFDRIKSELSSVIETKRNGFKLLEVSLSTKGNMINISCIKYHEGMQAGGFSIYKDSLRFLQNLDEIKNRVLNEINWLNNF